jgi:hypothetical protein
MGISFFTPTKRLINSSHQISLLLAYSQSHIQMKRIRHLVAHSLILSYLIIRDIQQNSITFINVTKKAKKKNWSTKSINHGVSNFYNSHYGTSLKIKEEKQGVYVYKAPTFFFSCYYELFQLILLHAECTLVALLFVSTSSFLDIAWQSSLKWASHSNFCKWLFD